MSSLANPRRRRLRALFALAGAALASTALASSAGASPATGEVTLTLKKGAQSSLLREGAKASPRSGKGETQTVKLPVADLDLSGPTRISTGATLTLAANGKDAKLRAVALQVGGKGTSISAKHGGKRTVFFQAKGAAGVDGLSVRLNGPLSLTPKGAKALRQALGLDGISSGKVGSAAARAVVTVTPPVPTPPVPAPDKPTPPAPPPSDYPYAAQCPITPVEGNPGFGNDPGEVSGILPAPIFGAEAREVEGTALDWGFKASFRSYVLNVDKKPGDSLVTLDGAGASASGSGMAAAAAFFSFPVDAGSYEAGTPDPGDEKLVADGTGTVVFCKTGHGFSVILKNPTLTIDGANSRITADVGANMNGKWFPLQRADIAELDLTGIDPEVSGDTVTWSEIPAELSADGALATGLYPENTPLDAITVEAELGPEPPEPYPYATECPVPTGGSMGEAPGEVSAVAPAPVFNVGTSQPVTGTSTEWGFKSTFRGYVLGAPPAGTLQTLDGATASAVGMGMAGPTAYFGFPTAAGTYEPGSAPDHSDDKLVAESSGTVLFCKSGHGFNVVLKNPTVTIDGEDSRITADVGVNLNGVWYPFQRADIAELDLSAVEPTLSDSGNTLVWEDIPATMTEDGHLATGLYEEGESLDAITVKTTLDRPLLTECTIVAGNPAPEPIVDFALDGLPVLDDPVVGSGGTINWGFRRAFRATIKTNGGFSLLGGATESYPGNMGGAAGAPPTGGDGKFFRFPISEYSYDAGAAGGADDRLIATSEASVGFCNPTHGYAALLSKPTLVIDGAESRIIANTYSFQNAKGWIGGRVEVVDFNSVGVDAVTGAGTVGWGEVLGNETPLSTGIPATGGFLTEALKLAAMSKGGAIGSFDPVAAQITLPPAP